MNYLAHIYLSGDCPDMMVGGLLGDFVKGPLQGNLPAQIEQGIQLHRKIDRFTDQQPEVVGALARFEPPFRRFAGIYLDLCYDHFLARDWPEFHHQSLAEFCQQFYRQLANHYSVLPAGAQRFNDIAPEVRWLESYANFEKLEPMLERIGQRFKKPVALANGFPLLQRDYQQLEQEFTQLFPRLVDFANSQRQQLY